MKNKMTEKEAVNYLLGLWENGLIPSNFTAEHSEHDRAVKQVMELGYLVWTDFF